MGIRSSILKQGSDTAFRKTFLRASLSEGALPIDATTLREGIQKAINDAGAIRKNEWPMFVEGMDDTTLKNTLTEMAHTNSNSFKRVIADLHNTDQAALRAFYAQSDDVVQKQMASAFDGGPAFFRADGKRAAYEAAEQGIRGSSDDGKSWFMASVWPHVTIGNTVSAAKWGALGLGIWTVISLLGRVTGMSIPDLFSEFFEFISDPAGAFCESESGADTTGCWKLTDMGQVFFGLIALVGIAGAVKFVKLLKTETSEA